MPLSAEQRQNLEAMGVRQVRFRLMAGTLPRDWWDPAANWLAEIDEADAQSAHNERQRQDGLASSSNRAAWIAAVAAVAGLLIGIATLFVSLHPAAPVAGATHAGR
jgi:hypothetical protein